MIDVSKYSSLAELEKDETIDKDSDEYLLAYQELSQRLSDNSSDNGENEPDIASEEYAIVSKEKNDSKEESNTDYHSFRQNFDGLEYSKILEQAEKGNFHAWFALFKNAVYLDDTEYQEKCLANIFEQIEGIDDSTKKNVLRKMASFIKDILDDSGICLNTQVLKKNYYIICARLKELKDIDACKIMYDVYAREKDLDNMSQCIDIVKESSDIDDKEWAALELNGLGKKMEATFLLGDIGKEENLTEEQIEYYYYLKALIPCNNSDYNDARDIYQSNDWDKFDKNKYFYNFMASLIYNNKTIFFNEDFFTPTVFLRELETFKAVNREEQFYELLSSLEFSTEKEENILCDIFVSGKVWEALDKNYYFYNWIFNECKQHHGIIRSYTVSNLFDVAKAIHKEDDLKTIDNQFVQKHYYDEYIKELTERISELSKTSNYISKSKISKISREIEEKEKEYGRFFSTPDLYEKKVYLEEVKTKENHVLIAIAIAVAIMFCIMAPVIFFTLLISVIEILFVVGLIFNRK